MALHSSSPTSHAPAHPPISIHTLSYPSPRPRPHIILNFLLPLTVSDLPLHRMCFSSSSHHRMSVTHVPATSTGFASQCQTPTQSPFSPQLGTVSLRDTQHIDCTILISVRSNLALCSTFMAHVSLPYTITLLTHVTI